MSDADLHDWLLEQEPGSEQYSAGEEESLRRVAVIEERMELAEAPSRRRERIAAIIAIISLAAIILFIVYSN